MYSQKKRNWWQNSSCHVWGIYSNGVVRCRVPEEAPQEIADLVLQCTGQPEQRPSAAECADIIRPHLLSATKSGIYLHDLITSAA